LKLALGTVQFGLDYGVSNRSGMTSAAEVKRILDVARQSGIRLLDTAASYGISEEVLGDALGGVSSFEIVTKTPPFAQVPVESRRPMLRETFHRSLARLRVREVAGLLVHQADDLLHPDGGDLFDELSALKRAGQVRAIGASVYSGVQIDRLMERFDLDLVQLPVSVLDQRLIRSGHLARLKKSGVEIHARSIFLQGLLLMRPDELPPHLHRAAPVLTSYRAWLSERNLNALDGAIGFVSALEEVDSIVVGVNSARHLAEIVTSAGTSIESSDLARFAVEDPALLNPALWPL
jgi:aryl-alcohol dehydrogenase-like predicted oxidoreductase